jgi:hypothetical protein
MKNRSTLILNIFCVIGFILYGIGIILYTVLLKQRWGNAAIDLGIQILGPIGGTIVVLLIEIGILISAYFISKIEKFSTATNIFLCWFWIFSLYQCAINTFLSLQNLPNEPINLFFKTLWPTFWYPIKEMVFIAVAILLTYIWFQKVNLTQKITRYDIILIILISLFFWLTIALSQIAIINTGENVYS